MKFSNWCLDHLALQLEIGILPISVFLSLLVSASVCYPTEENNQYRYFFSQMEDDINLIERRPRLFSINGLSPLWATLFSFNMVIFTLWT